MNKSLVWLRLHNPAAEIDWDAVFTETLPRVFNYVFYRVGDEALAEDLTAKTFESAWKDRRRYRPDRASPLTWLLGIARHTVADHFRCSRADLSLDAARHLPSAHSTDEVAEQQARLERLHALLQQLPAREQELIALKYGASLTNRDIAALTGLSESNVGTILSRAIHKLRETWGEPE